MQAVIDAMVARGLAPRTVRTNFGVLRAIFAWAVDNDLIERSPCRTIRMPSPKPQRKALASADDIDRLAEMIAPAYRAAIYLGALGLRQGEVFGLTVGAIDFSRRTITVNATMNEVEVGMTP